MATWKVNEGTQVKHRGKLHAAGDTFSATESEVTAAGLTSYITRVEEKKASAPNKAQTSSPNKSK